MKQVFKSFIVSVLTFEARLILKKYKPKIVAVTGSVGKTTTKDAIYHALKSAFHVRKSEKSYNSEIGIPLTILGCQNAWYNPIGWLQNIFKGLSWIIFRRRFPEWLVLEVGADRPGDIESVSAWLRPDVVVFTAFATLPVHVEFFENAEALFREKSFLVTSLKEGGHLVLNGDHEKVRALGELRRTGRVTTYAVEGPAAIVASHIEPTYEKKNNYASPRGITFKINYENNSIPVVVNGVLGKQHVYPILAAVAVGLGEGINVIRMEGELSSFVPPRGRMNLIEGIKDTMIIDDTYNASPIAVEEALQALKSLKTGGRKIAVLGDMMELGKHSAEAHQAIGRLLESNVDLLATVGVRAREIAEVALQNGMSEKQVFQFEEAREAGAFLQNHLREGDTILIKGSQSVRLERTVEELMAHPEQKGELLVRQEKEWQLKLK